MRRGRGEGGLGGRDGGGKEVEERSPNNAAVQNRLRPRGLIGYLRDDLFLLLKKFISFFLSYLNLVIPLR